MGATVLGGYVHFSRLQTLSLRYYGQHPHGVLTIVGVAVMMIWINSLLAAVNLLTHFYDIDGGHICIDGH